MGAKRHILVLLHPFPMDASFWGPMWRELAADVTLLTPEFPGFGAEPRTASPSIDAFADTVAEVIRDEAAGAATVVGLSLGGYAALSLALRHPDVVARLLLANTRADADDDVAGRARNAAIDTIRIDGLDVYLATLLPRLVGPAAGADAWERADAIAGGQDPDAVCAALEALRDRPDRTARLGEIDVPTIVVAGADDTVTPREAAEALADGIPGAVLQVLEDAGHFSALDQPAAFAHIVRAMLADPGR